MFSFGSGVLYGVRTDVANSTPINFGLVQDVQMDFQYDHKELYGQNQFPVAVARGKGKVTGKAKIARISGMVFNSLFFGATLQTGQIATAFGEAATIPAVSDYTVTAANNSQIVTDYGVVYAATGLPFVKVATAPAVGQYSLSGGVYAFAAADAGAAVLLTYTYNITTSGQIIKVTNPLMGTTPTFSASFYTTFQGKSLTCTFPNCVSNTLKFGTKLDDFLIPEIDFSAFADGAGNVATMSFNEVS